MMRAPIHPGETLREDLDALGMSAAELARRIEVLVNRITEILNGRRAVTGDTALRLGRFSRRRASSGSTSRSSTNCGVRSRRTARRSPACPRWTPATGCGLRGEIRPWGNAVFVVGASCCQGVDNSS